MTEIKHLSEGSRGITPAFSDELAAGVEGRDIELQSRSNDAGRHNEWTPLAYTSVTVAT